MTVAEIIDEAKKLPAEELRLFVEALLEASRPGAKQAPNAQDARHRFLVLAGRGKSEHRDVSLEKYRHLGETYSNNDLEIDNVAEDKNPKGFLDKHCGKHSGAALGISERPRIPEGDE